MYIKEIKINGFKSFADKTSIVLDKTFTGIVGPNGSGKSNIVDAIKWVLGEQSIKSLRGENNMTDVIFSGSSTRNALNHASVSIVFDNSNRDLNIDYNEVEIKRIVYKTGENEYYINNEKCRLKDISNLLIDNMSSKESFNIVPQKRVSDILSEKSEDRRIIFEDASGVLKYKKRKEETLRKLDKTHDNISRVEMIINELSENLTPLEESAKKAREYKNISNELENIEIALIAKDISAFSVILEDKKTKKEELELELSKISTLSVTENNDVESIKTEILKIDDEIREITTLLVTIGEELIELSNKKTLMTERNKYDKKSNSIKNNVVQLKEMYKIKLNDKKVIENELENLDNSKYILNEKITNLTNELNKIEITKNSLIEKYNLKLKSNVEINNKIDILELSINNMSKIPYSVKAIIDNPTLRGVHNILGNLVETESEYATMLDIALGFSSNNIITDDETTAKEAIEYLKSHNKGRATFFPLNVIKPRSIDPNIKREINNIIGFIGIASDLVTYDSKYYNIVMNQLGNIIVAKDINSAIQISKKINHQYRVVSLNGDMLHVGGSLTGGSIKQNNSFISDKYELDKLKLNKESLKKELDNFETQINKYNNETSLLKEKIYEINIESVKLNELINSKNISLNEVVNSIKLIDDELNDLSNDNTLDKELETVIEQYYDKENEKNLLEKKLEISNKNKLELNSELKVLETSLKKKNSENNSLLNEINALEIDITKLNIALDNLLNRLNEDYQMTYDRAKSNYTLEIDEKEARDKVSSLRRRMKLLGEVNLGSIDEYERISTRVNFLNCQRDDLKKSEEDLLSIINDMDNVMKDKFRETFDKINIEFNKVFKELFRGGEAHLKLTNPDDILNTGIDIIAVPSGKSLKPISLLSGGERTLTAISLLFAIMNNKDVPFVILDEVESDLDDNNVNIFCDYLTKYKKRTQLLIITHKKKTMEYLDTLYGITMQESGVSKLVSVKLEN